MAQVQQVVASSNTARPATPKRTPSNLPRLSPSRIPDQVLTASSFRSGHINLDTFSPVNQNGSFEFDRVIRSGRVLRRVKKKGAWKPSWKSTYLVLRPNLLSVYKNADETELKASITLSDVTAVARVKKTNTENVFGVFTPAKNFHFSGVNEIDTSNWVTLLRIESRIEGEEDLDLAPPDLRTSHGDNPGSESTELSAEDDPDPPGSPEAPQWSVRGSRARVGSNSNRKPSNLREWSGNEAFTTSQSDLSDSMPLQMTQPLSSIPHLSPIPDGSAVTASRPSFQRSTSQLSISKMQQQQQALQQTTAVDPNRVIRQSYIHLSKTVPGTGVRQWKQVWMVLRTSSLALYKSSNEYEPLKIMQISDLIDAAEIDPVSKNKRYCLQIIGLEKTWRFGVDSETELEGWLGALKSVLTRKARSRGHSLAQQPGQPLTQVQSAQAYPHSSQSAASLAGVLHAQASNSGQVQSTGINPVWNRSGTMQRSEGALNGIVEGTEEMTVH